MGITLVSPKGKKSVFPVKIQKTTLILEPLLPRQTGSLVSSVSLASGLFVTLSSIHRLMSKSFPYFKEYSISAVSESFLTSENESRL